MIDNLNFNIDGHVKIWDPTTEEVFVSKHNAINPEAMSLLIASCLASGTSSFISEMHFGNGGTIIDDTGNITYKDVVNNLQAGTLAELFQPTYFKIVDATDADNTDPTQNNVVIAHTQGLNYTDVVITCTLANNEPANQLENDNSVDFTGEYIFNELGLKSQGDSGPNTGVLLSHIVFHPVQKSSNRVIQIVYTLRVRIL